MTVPVRARFVLALLALVALASPRALFAQGTGTIEGTVIDAGSRRPVANAQITIRGTGGGVGAMTNAQGAFRILNVAPGTRIVRARLLGYSPVERNVEVAENQTATVAMELNQSAIE
jgi:outer membrane receptor for ferrienterochelin and colicins